MATYLLDLDNGEWVEVDLPFSPDRIGPITRFVGATDADGYYVDTFKKGTVALYPGTLTGQIDILMLKSNVADLFIVCARDTLQ